MRDTVRALQFVKESVIRAPAERVWAFHEAPDAFEVLQPPWQTVEIVRPPTSLKIGTQVELRLRVGPFWQTIIAEHIDYAPGRMFVDTMIKGPFAKWVHKHIISPIDDGACTLTDDVEYELPFGVLGRLAGGGYARRDLERLFTYRHQVTRQLCEL